MDSNTLSTIQDYTAMDDRNFDSPLSKELYEIEGAMWTMDREITKMRRTDGLPSYIKKIIYNLNKLLYTFEDRVDYLKQRLVNTTGENFDVTQNRIDKDGNIC